MIWKLPEGVKPSLIVGPEKDQRPGLAMAFLTRDPKDQFTYELLVTNAFIMGRFPVQVSEIGSATPPELVVISYDALCAVEKHDARAFTLVNGECCRPVNHETFSHHGVMYDKPVMPSQGVPSWGKLTSDFEDVGFTNAYQFGINHAFLERLGRGLGARNGLAIKPGASPLRAITVHALGLPEREGLIMPIRLNV